MTPLPPTCRVAVFVGAGQPLELRTIPVPTPSAGGALVRIDCCALCGSDLHTMSGHRHEPTPSVLGHEAVGVVVATGSPPLHDIDGLPLQPGDRVSWSPVLACGECDRCQGGLPQKCRSLFKYGHALAEGPDPLHGGLADFIHLRPRTTVVRLGADVPDEVFCPVNCATATVAAAFRAAGPVMNDRVLILGAGMLGLTGAAFARTLGASLVVLCDPSPSRLALASRFGADRGLEWLTEPEAFRQRLRDEVGTELFDLVLEVSGAAEAVEAACRLGDIGGRVMLVGSVSPSRSITIDPESIVRRLLTIRGVHNYAPEDLRAAVEFLRQTQTRFPFAQLVERTFPLSRINEAVENARQNRPVRLAIRPHLEDQ